MPIGAFFGVLRRRWLLVLVGFLMTVGLSGAAYMFFKPTYEITGTVLLLPPSSSSSTGSGNPYLRLGGLQQVVDLMGVALSDQATQLELRAISKDVDFTVRADVRTSSPLLVIDVKDSSATTALQIRDILVARVPVRLDEMQKELNVGSTDRVTSTVVTLDGQAEEVGKNRLRAAVVAGVGGLALTLLVAAVWDARRVREARGRVRRGVRPNRTQSVATSVEPAVVSAVVSADDSVVEAADETAGETLATPASHVSPREGVEAPEVSADAPDDSRH